MDGSRTPPGDRRTLVWHLAAGLVAAGIVAAFAAYRGVTWNLPLVLVLVLAAFSPLAREAGSRAARRAAARRRAD